MEEKKINKYGIALDGCMDEPIWESAKEYTGFQKLKTHGGGAAPAETIFKILPCEDRVYIGVKCMEPDGMEEIIKSRYDQSLYNGHSVELFLSPCGSNQEYYQFVITINADTYTQYYSESGFIRPDPYKPNFACATYLGEDYWSAEIEFPLTAFYWTFHDHWSDKWLVNITRNRLYRGATQYSTWSDLEFNYHEPKNFRAIDGFPIRPERNDVRIFSAAVDLTNQTEDGYTGIMTVKTDNAVADEFVFASNYSEKKTVKLTAGSNEFTVPCFFEKEGKKDVMLSLTRTDDGELFKRHYPVRAVYEPIVLKLTLPEYRNNFYPGQDYSKVVGTVKTAKPVTLKLEGPGIETTEITLAAGGDFQFATPNFEEGEAWLTATIDGYEIKKKIRRLAPTAHKMTWISGGNLIVNGKPILRRNMYARDYKVGTAFDRRFEADNLYETEEFAETGLIHVQPQILLAGSEASGGEATKDQYPSEEMLRKVDALCEKYRDSDIYAYYISDEPECRSLSTVYLKHLYEYVADKDPYHLILTASRNADGNVEIADWFEAHPYLNPLVREDGKRVYDRPISCMGTYIDKIVKLNRPDKCIGFLPTCFAYKWNSLALDYPTFDEYITHTWAAMIHGGKSLWPYAAHDMNDRPALYEGTRYVFSSFAALEDIVLHGKRTRLLHNDIAEAVLYEHGDEKMFVLVNFTQEPQTITLDGLTGTWHEFRSDRIFTGNTFQLPSVSTIIGLNVVKGADLPTYAETAALVEKLEYERTHTGSLLYDRADDIKLTTSGFYKMTYYKLFDGMQDNLAGWVDNVPDNFIELDLTVVKPAFRKVVLRGYQIEDALVKIRVNGELVDPAVTETSLEEYAKTFMLADTVEPEALRFEFNGARPELYEIEVF